MRLLCGIVTLKVSAFHPIYPLSLGVSPGFSCGEFLEALGQERTIVPAENLLDRELRQSGQAAQVHVIVFRWKFPALRINKRRFAAKKVAVVTVEEGDTAGRASWYVQNFQLAVAKVDDVTIMKHDRRLTSSLPIVSCLEI